MNNDLQPQSLYPAPPLWDRLKPFDPRRLKASDVPRLAGYAVMAFVAWLLVSTLFRPWFSTSASRAILDAPAMWVTSPIDGTVTAISTRGGEGVAAGQTIAVVSNATVSRDNLNSLLTRQLDLQGQSAQLDSAIRVNQGLLDDLSAEYTKYRTATDAQSANELGSARARVRAAEATADALEDRYLRQVAMAEAGAVSHDAVSAAQAALTNAYISKDVAALDAHTVAARHRNAKAGIYLASDGSNLLTQFQQRQVDLRAQIAQETDQKTAVDGQLTRLTAMVNAEQARVDSLSRFEIKANGNGVTQEVVTPVGTQVHAGATLVRTTDCANANVVGVFPSRIASQLSRGSVMHVKVDGVPGTLKARVVQLLPTAPDAAQSAFIAPFPYAESGAVYAVGEWDRTVPSDVIAKTCQPGRSVEVSAD